MKRFAILLALMLAAALASAQTIHTPTIASIEIVHEAGQQVSFDLGTSAPAGYAWHVLVREPSGAIDTLWGLTSCDKGTLENCADTSITFTIPRSYAAGDYTVIGGTVFDVSFKLGAVLHVIPYQPIERSRADLALIRSK